MVKHALKLKANVSAISPPSSDFPTNMTGSAKCARIVFETFYSSIKVKCVFGYFNWICHDESTRTDVVPRLDRI